MKELLTKPFTPSLLSILRIWLGFMMMRHSYEPLLFEGVEGFARYVGELGFPAPMLFAYLAKGGEFIGGLLVLLGFFARIGAFLIIITMAVAVFIAHSNSILGDGELALNYLLIAIVVFWDNPTNFSLSIFINKE